MTRTKICSGKSITICITLIIISILTVLNLTGCYSPSKSEHFSVVGAYHSLTGFNEPTEYNTDSAEDIAMATKDLQATEESSDEKTIVVLAKITPDEKENLEVGSSDTLSTGESFCDAELTIDGTNSYRDIYDINRREFKSVYLDNGFHDGGTADTVNAKTNDYYVAFAFLVAKNDFENGETAKLEWGNYTTEFKMSDIKEGSTPLEILSLVTA